MDYWQNNRACKIKVNGDEHAFSIMIRKTENKHAFQQAPATHGQENLSVGIMQPYFFPYLGYYAIIANTKKWVVFDSAQYSKRSWISRNRVLHPVEGWQYINVPVQKFASGTPINQIQIKEPDTVLINILGRLAHYKKRAPYYDQVINLLKNIFECPHDGSLLKLNISALEKVCQYLDINLDYKKCSELEIAIKDNPSPGDWAPSIAHAVGATRYLNPTGGIHLFNKSAFRRVGCVLDEIDSLNPTYRTKGYCFVNKLSVIDTMMWCDSETIKKFIDEAEIRRVF